DSALSSGVKTFSATLTKAGAQTITATDTAAASLSGTLSLTVRAGSATQLALTTGTATRTARTAFSYSVTAQDPSDNSSPGYAAPLHLSTTDTADGTLLRSDSALSSGVNTFSATLTKAGAQTITATDTATASISGTLSLTVRPASATQL